MLRGRGWRRLLGLLPMGYSIGHHTLVNYTGRRDAEPPGWATSLRGTADDLVAYVPLVCLLIAIALDFGQLQRSKRGMPTVLLDAERAGRTGTGALAGFGGRCLPWTAVIALRFARMRRALLYAAGRTDPERLELLHQAVADTAARIDAADREGVWNSGRIRAHLKATRHSRPWRRRWPLLAIPLVLMLPSLLFLGVGSFTLTKGLQESFTTGIGPSVLMWFGIAGLAWCVVQLVLLIRAWRTTRGLLEAHGVRVFSLSRDCPEVDAFSFRDRGIPFILLSTEKTAERGRFDAAHELGHLVMHGEEQVPHGPQAEGEAHRFAAALLMPAADVLAYAPRNPSTNWILQAKRRWKVAAMALAHRLHELNLTTEWQYRTHCVELSRLGYRRDEPQSRLGRETSQVLGKVFAALRAEGIRPADVSRDR
ncbi:ImmA/IrrE family metallo-endopeptidase [Streptomyces sp. NPDC051776]|uniref:ImmA/IrrE family metallo-endopeptidase n=1 Tax=Streptomyces sp. NPDC051776 TaxID=3155414 RepID=UPI003424B9E7